MQELIQNLMMLVILLIFCCAYWKNNYYLSGMLMLAILFYGVYVIAQIENELFVVLLMIFSVMLSVFNVEYGIKLRSK